MIKLKVNRDIVSLDLGTNLIVFTKGNSKITNHMVTEHYKIIKWSFKVSGLMGHQKKVVLSCTTMTNNYQ